MKDRMVDFWEDNWTYANSGRRIWTVIRLFLLIVVIGGLLSSIFGLGSTGVLGSYLGQLFSTSEGYGLFSGGAVIRGLLGVGFIALILFIIYLASNRK